MLVDLRDRQNEADSYWAPYRAVVVQNLEPLVTVRGADEEDTADESGLMAKIGIPVLVGTEGYVLRTSGGSEIFLPLSSIDPDIGTTIADGASSTNAEINSTTSTANFQNARSVSVSCDNGFYDVFVVGSGVFSHSANGTVDIRVTCATSAAQSASEAGTVTTNIVTRLEMNELFPNVEATANDLTVRFQYKAQTAGTVNCRNAQVLIFARRLS